MPELHLLTGAYALDALDGVERAGFERHLRGCDSCTTEVAEFREAVVGLADRVAQAPPEGLRERVLGEVVRTRQVSPRRAGLPRPSLRRSLTLAAAVVVLAGGAGLGGITWESHQQAQTAQAEASRIARVVTDPSRLEVVGSTANGGSVTVVAARGTAVFTVDQLPATAKGRTYQLWLIHPKAGSTGKAVTTSAGLLKVHGGSAQSVVSGVTPGVSVAMSVEPDGGSKQPTTTPILALPVV
jgi:anti-sigma-K factor RskA